jgi:tripartite-type tricarboxylate transporter receptor subunit TctC
MKRILALALYLFVAAAFAQAQVYPDRPIRIVVPYPPAGGTDTLTRLVAKYMGDSFKQAIIVENRPGGNAQIGMDVVMNAARDGYTLMAIAAGRSTKTT